MFQTRILILLLGDLVIVFLSYFAMLLSVGFASGWIDPQELFWDSYFFEEDHAWWRLGFITLSIITGMYFIGLYERVRVESRRRLAEDLLLVFGVAFLMQSLASYTRTPMAMPRTAMLGGAFGALVALILWRSLYTKILVSTIGRQRILFWGYGTTAEFVIQHIMDHPEKGFDVIGVIDVEDSGKESSPNMEKLFIKPNSNLIGKIDELAPDRIVVSRTMSPNEEIATELLRCSMAGLRVENLGDLYELLLQRVSLDLITMNQLIFSPAFRPAVWKRWLQNIYGSLIAIVGIALTWYLMVLTAIAVRCDSKGPALLRQRRIGLDGKEFEILKFRSMYVDGDERFGTIRADKGDPRITRVGRWIRVTRLDELPQFFNVLRGDMSLVGPRPEIPVYVEKLSREIPLYPQRHRVKPGITGWAQLHHVPEMTVAETKYKVEHDLYYIKNMSPVMDFLIMFHTLKTLILRTGAR
jgi:exopolysaccharide biosynthesis polyprenyl glycosylphosphotransferase